MSEAGVIDIFFTLGPKPADVLRQFTTLTGRPALPPLFAIAYHQCRWNYQDAKVQCTIGFVGKLGLLNQDVAAVNAKFEELDIPYDVLWLDIEHTEGKRYFTWDARTFAEPEVMINEVAKYGRKMVAIVDPHIKRDKEYVDMASSPRLAI